MYRGVMYKVDEDGLVRRFDLPLAFSRDSLELAAKEVWYSCLSDGGDYDYAYLLDGKDLCVTLDKRTNKMIY